MALKGPAALELARTAKEFRDSERAPLDEVRRYWKGRQGIPAVIASGAPREVHVLARLSRVNICAIVVDSLAQSAFVEGYRTKDTADDLEVWNAWQKNRLDARQTGIHRATFAYGTGYAVVTPGEPVPVIRGVSPRQMTAVYGDDPDWPMFALERTSSKTWRLYDETSIYYLGGTGTETDDFEFIEARPHGQDVTPVVRYLDEDDLDADDDVESNIPADRGGIEMPTRGQVSPLQPVQDQIDLTTFNLMVAQHYSAFRQRWIIGWTGSSENDVLKAAASKIWTFDEDPNEMKLGEFEQTDPTGYIKSREASMRHAASLSQTPVHELIGDLVNLSAEALAAAEAGHDRKVGERKTLLGESHEQTFSLAGHLMGVDVPDDAQVVWRDTSARAFAATVDALGKLVTMLKIPPQELWERVPGASKQDIDRWKVAAEKGDSFQMLADILERQGAPGRTPDPEA